MKNFAVFNLDELEQKLSSELEQVNKDIELPYKSGNTFLLYSRQGELYHLLDLIRKIQAIDKKIANNKELIEESKSDTSLNDLRQMALQENSSSLHNKKVLLKELKSKIKPRDKNDFKNAVLEIRAGVGGEEATIFANNLFRMYSRFIDKRGWNIQIISLTPSSENDGIKEAVLKVEGKEVYGTLKYESGVHRVQRIPKTESQGRIHTSAASVVLMPEVDDIEIKLNMEEVRVDVFRSSGHGGQSVNTTDSAVRVTHIPTNIVVSCQQTKDQIRNKETALGVLKSKLYQLELDKRNAELSAKRQSSIRTGDRSEKIKTYNFPQNRLTDHRIKKTWFGLETILAGEIEEILKETQEEIMED